MVTSVFLMSDIEGSTRLWATHGAAMAEALRTHDGLFAAAIVEGGGELFKHTGDGVIARFEAAASAIAAAVAASRALAGTVWGDTGPIRSRIGIHAGEAEARGGDYYGAALNRTARLMAVGHGGQVLVSAAVAGLARDVAGKISPAFATIPS